jgi:hypothetical protein
MLQRCRCFAAAASYLVLNAVRDYRGFAATLAASLRPGGRLVLAFNNPYGGVIGRHVNDYFDSGAVSRYRGLWDVGIKTYYYHRTLEDYLDAFLGNGLRLAKLTDVRAGAGSHRPDAHLPDGARFPASCCWHSSRPPVSPASWPAAPRGSPRRSSAPPGLS